MRPVRLRCLLQLVVVNVVFFVVILFLWRRVEFTAYHELPEDYSRTIAKLEKDTSRLNTSTSRSLIGLKLNSGEKIAEIYRLFGVSVAPLARGLTLPSIPPNLLKKMAPAMVKMAEGKMAAFTTRKSQKKNTKSVCGMKSVCGTGQVGYSIDSGVKKDELPKICVDGVMALKNAGRGINVVIYDVVKEQVGMSKVFDTYSDGDQILNFLTRETNANQVLLFVTYDDATNSLKDTARRWLSKHGSKKILELKFRGSWAMVGQRGLEKAQEALSNPAKVPEYGEPVHLDGCFAIPQIAPLTVVGVADELDGFVEKGTQLENCGLANSCSEGEFPFHLFTGQEDKITSKICYNGVYYMEKGVNDAGRGLNVIVIDGKTKNVTKRSNFDTYSADSTELEIFLGVLHPGDVAVIVTHDDASTHMGVLAQKLLAELGGALVSKMASNFRAAYILVAKKGAGAVAEEISLPTGSGFPPPINVRTCLKL